MVHLRLLSGNDPGSVLCIRRFPCLIGRGSAAQVRLEDAGVWDRHLELRLSPSEGIAAQVLPGALATINGEKLERSLLRNGDILQLGSARLQFWLSPTRQRSFRLREQLTWIAFAALCAAQLCLIYKLLP
jgi:hypothetical protein